MKDPEYRLFYEADTSDPKDLEISFSEWSDKYITINSEAEVEFKSKIFKAADADGNDWLSFREFSGAIEQAAEESKDPDLVLFEAYEQPAGQMLLEQWNQMYKAKNAVAGESFMAEVFTESDADKDQQLSFAEFKQSLVNAETMWALTPEGKLQLHFTKSDASYDGRVSL